MSFTVLNFTPLNLQEFKRKYYTKDTALINVPVLKFISFLLISSIITSGALYLLKSSPSTRAEVISPITSIEKILHPQTRQIVDNRTLKNLVDKQLTESDGTFAVEIRNFKTQQTYSLNPHLKLSTASLYKLWIMATAYEMIQSGKLSEDEYLKKDARDLNNEFNIASEEADINEGEVAYKVSDALDKMITVSDNYAALLLSDRIGYSNITTFLKDHNYTESSYVQPPSSSAADIAAFLTDLYTGKLADQSNTEKMISLLKQQKLNGKLPKYLPEEVVVAHKTGELNDVTHDAGIVLSSKGDYVIVVLTESDDTVIAEEQIAKLSKAIYDYFEG